MAIQDLTHDAAALDCFVAALLAMTVLEDRGTRKYAAR
jgi:hypothetical protein